jgi:hypothetical protein
MVGRGWKSTAALAGALGLLGAAVASTTLAHPRIDEAEKPAARVETTGAQMSLSRSDDAAVVVVLDGVRWQDVFLGVDDELAASAGLNTRLADARPTMPRTLALARTHGALFGAPDTGSEMRASGPNYVSLPGYTEILGGHAPTNCADNECPGTTRETFADAVRARSDVPHDVAVFSSWPDVVRAASRAPDRLVASGGRSVRYNAELLLNDPAMASLLDEGSRVDPAPGAGDYRPDSFTAPLAARYFAVARPRFLFVSLGDTDEYAHAGDYAGYLAALRFDDDFIADLAAARDRMGARGKHTTIYVTADHGRAFDFRDHGGAWPESSRSWLVVLGETGARGTVVGGSVRHLADIAPTLGAWLGIPEYAATDSGTPIEELLPPGFR